MKFNPTHGDFVAKENTHSKNKQFHIITSGPKPKYLASVNSEDCTDEECEANAHLFAASKELLNALQTLVDKCLSSDGYNQKVDELYTAQQAIKLAKGEVK